MLVVLFYYKICEIEIGTEREKTHEIFPSYFRDPGQTHKEDFETGTAAALAGGITLIGAMPNTEPAIHDAQTLLLAEEKAKKAHCDYALYLGATPYNAQDIVPLSTQAAALKMYLNPTFRKGNLFFNIICLQ